MLHLKAKVNDKDVIVIERYLSYGHVPWVKVVSHSAFLNCNKDQLEYMTGCYPESSIKYDDINFLTILQLDVESFTYYIPHIFFVDWGIFPEDLCFNLDFSKLESESRICVKYIKKHYYDHRRTWELGYITFDDHPIVVFAGAGREGCDSYKNDILNKVKYDEAVQYLQSLCPPDRHSKKPVSLSAPADHYINFYDGHILSEFKKY